MASASVPNEEFAVSPGLDVTASASDVVFCSGSGCLVESHGVEEWVDEGVVVS
jgi:hypothetical protein